MCVECDAACIDINFPVDGTVQHMMMVSGAVNPGIFDRGVLVFRDVNCYNIVSTKFDE